MGTGGFSSESNRLLGKSDHSLPPLNAEVKNAWSYTSTLPLLHGVMLNGAQGHILQNLDKTAGGNYTSV
jgi:hypothetical protein